MPPRPSSPTMSYLPTCAGRSAVLRGAVAPPAVALDDLVADREPEPGALADLLGGEERVEDLGQDLRRDAVPVVGHLHRDVLAIGLEGAHVDDAALLRGRPNGRRSARATRLRTGARAQRRRCGPTAASRSASRPRRAPRRPWACA